MLKMISPPPWFGVHVKVGDPRPGGLALVTLNFHTAENKIIILTIYFFQKHKIAVN